jgi:hypothetical protein
VIEVEHWRIVCSTAAVSAGLGRQRKVKSKMKGIDAFPLSWPDGWQRTPINERRSSKYQVSFGKARDDLVEELRLFGVQSHDAVISTNVALRIDGLPYSNQREPNDPGVAVYWSNRKLGSRVIACDAWRTVRENLRAVGLAIQGLRLIERTQASEILKRAFTGFAALPASSSLPSWATILGFTTIGGLTLDDVEAAYRKRVQEHHPDRGGEHEAMVQLNRARDEAREALRTWARPNGSP